MSEEHRQLGGQGYRGVPRHFGALIPPQGSAHECAHAADVVDEHVRETVGVLALEQRQDHGEPAGALHQGRCGTLAAFPDDELLACGAVGDSPEGDGSGSECVAELGQAQRSATTAPC